MYSIDKSLTKPNPFIRVPIAPSAGNVGLGGIVEDIVRSSTFREEVQKPLEAIILPQVSNEVKKVLMWYFPVSLAVTLGIGWFLWGRKK